MSSIHNDLDSFNQFVAQRLSANDSPASLEELFLEWQDRRDRDEINEAIRRGLADVDAGCYEPASGAMEAIREEFGFPRE